jgi:hypothetical protein
MDASPEAVEQLLTEIERYLALVDALRRDGREPTWAPELAARVSGV